MSTIKLKGSSSGEAEVTVAAAAGTPTFTLPTTVGSANQLVKNSGTAGTLEYSNNLTFDGTTLKITDTELAEASDNFSINIQSGNNDFYVKSGGTTIAAFKGLNKHLEITDGNLVIGTSGHGIDFSATSDATGKTSELLDDYEQGTWSPNFRTYSGSSWADVSFTTNPTTNIATYTKVGNIVRVSLWMYGFQTSTSGSAYAAIGNLPYSCVNQQGAGTVGYTNNTFSNENQNRCLVSTTELEMYIENNWATWADGSSASLYITAVYQTA